MLFSFEIIICSPRHGSFGMLSEMALSYGHNANEQRALHVYLLSGQALILEQLVHQIRRRVVQNGIGGSEVPKGQSYSSFGRGRHASIAPKLMCTNNFSTKPFPIRIYCNFFNGHSNLRVQEHHSYCH